MILLLPLFLMACASPPQQTGNYSYFDDGYKLCLKKGHVEDSKEHRLCIIQYVRSYRAQNFRL